MTSASLRRYSKPILSFNYFVSGETRSLSHADELLRLYDGVEAFVLFIGYPRSSHSLVGAILDAHPEIIIPHEYDLLDEWNKFQPLSAKRKNLQKYLLFYELHQLSTRQALFGIRANNFRLDGEFTYAYNVPDLWQGGYDKRIKVKAHSYQPTRTSQTFFPFHVF